MKRMNCLDGLRGVLAVYVMISHMAPFAAAPAWLLRPLSHGMAAVDVFFILSGMVIPLSLDGFGYRAAPFLLARVFRIFPVFLVVFVAAVAIQPLGVAFETMPWIEPGGLAPRMWADGWPSDWAGNILAHLTMTHGLFPDGAWPHVYLGFLGAAWSLSTEWQFYVLAVLFARRGNEPFLIAGFLGLSAGAILLQATAPEAWQFSRAFLPNKAQYFALGLASAALLRSGNRPRFAMVLATVLALCWLQGGGGKLAAPLVWTICLAAQITAAPWLSPIGTVLRSRPLVWLGSISFCIYLTNEPVQKLLGLGLAPLAGGNRILFTAVWAPLALLLPIGLSWWLHEAVERPALRVGRGFAQRLIDRRRAITTAAE
jgi:peptidoglycan/LPS O-acetylase OafA/YrhL